MTDGGHRSRVQNDFVAAAKRALTAGFEWLELHAAHGYLFNEFLSPLANHRTDQYGGSFENRIRLLLDTTRAVRQIWPDKLPLAVRISAIDWKEGGWQIEDSIALAKLLKAEGVDLMDCSSGGVVPDAKIIVKPGYQVPFAEKIRQGAEIATAAVGFITEPKQADDIVRNGQADMVLLGAADAGGSVLAGACRQGAGPQAAAAESIRAGVVRHCIIGPAIDESSRWPPHHSLAPHRDRRCLSPQ